MTEINGFDFSKYDIGGADATSGDGKLTGAEARAARADGWTIWDGFSEENEAPENVNQGVNNNTEQEGNLSDRLGNIKLPKWALDLIKRQYTPDSSKTKQLFPFEIIDGEIIRKQPVESTTRPISYIELSEEDRKKALDKLQEALKKEGEVKINGKSISDYIADITGKNDGKLTAEQKEARAELNQKQSSIGMTYADAKAKVAEILQKYPDCYYEVEVSNEPQPDENGQVVLIYITPTNTKVFNPDKLPEPARTEYKEAMASMTEIENANSALAQKGKISVNPMPKNVTPHYQTINDIDTSQFKGLGFSPAQKAEPTETQKSARVKLNEKVSSTGMSYKDAKATIESITKQYKNNPDYQSEFEQEQPKDIYVYYPPIKAFDPHKLKGADNVVYFRALSAIQEIEKSNYALLVQAGLSMTPSPMLPKNDNNIIYY